MKPARDEHLFIINSLPCFTLACSSSSFPDVICRNWLQVGCHASSLSWYLAALGSGTSCHHEIRWVASGSVELSAGCEHEVRSKITSVGLVRWILVSGLSLLHALAVGRVSLFVSTTLVLERPSPATKWIFNPW